MSTETTGRTDGELLSAYVDKHDSLAFKELHERYAGLIFTLAMRFLKNHQDAEDAAAACFVVLLKKAATLRNRANLGGWFHWCAVRTARNALVVRMHRAEREQEVYEMQKSGGPQDSNDFSAAMPQLEARLAELPGNMRDVLVMFFYQGLTRVQIAEKIGRPEGTVATWMSRGIARLRQSMSADMSDETFSENFSRLAVVLPVPASLLGVLTMLGEGQAMTGSVLGLADKVASSIFWGQVKVGAIAAASVVVVGGGAMLAIDRYQSAAGGKNDEPGHAIGTNPFRGSRESAGVYEFAERPRVKALRSKEWLITFATKSACDATVSIVGRDGRIIRHVASGVLGKNAPWPFKQDSLSQSIVWDGRDDTGAAVPDSILCDGTKAKVGLGLTATYDRSLAREPALLGYRPGGLACDREGNVYCLIQNESTTLYVLNRDGKYVRTIMPFPANLPVSSLPGLEFSERIDGIKVPMTTRSGAGAYCFYNCALPPNLSESSVSVSDDGKSVFLACRNCEFGGVPSWVLLRVGMDGGLIGASSLLCPSSQYNAVPGPSVAIGADGMVYWTAARATGSDHAIVRQKVDAMTPFARSWSPVHKTAPTVIAGEIGKPGGDDLHLKAPDGIAVDAGGNLLVADRGNNRVQIFGQDGKVVSSIAVRAPGKVQVHPRTGNIYVLAEDWSARKTSVIKFDKESKARLCEAILVQDKAPPYGTPCCFCLDSSGEDAAIWVSDAAGMKKFAERDGKFEKVLDFAEDLQAKWAGWNLSRSPVFMGHQWLAADPNREEIYMRLGGMSEGSAVIRIDGLSGRLIGQPASRRASEACVGPDGLVYIAVESGRNIVRFDPSTGKPVPFEKGSVEVGFMGEKVKAIRTATVGGDRNTGDGLCVAPNGDIYVAASEPPSVFLGEIRKVGQAGDINAAGKMLGGGAVDVLQVFGPDGELKHVSALPGLPPASGLRVMRNGNVLLNGFMRGAGVRYPDGIVPGRRTPGDWGTIICFNSALDKFPVGAIRGTWDEPLTGTATHVSMALSGKQVAIDNMRWDYTGVAPVESRFDLDGFDRVWLPAMHTASINVLDANGNLIVRIGRYGNADSRGADSAVADPGSGLLRPRMPDDPPGLQPPQELASAPGFCWVRSVAVTDEAAYIGDQGNSRVVRCRLGHVVEESIPLQQE